jgi:hypothetical protein
MKSLILLDDFLKFTVIKIGRGVFKKDSCRILQPPVEILKPATALEMKKKNFYQIQARLLYDGRHFTIYNHLMYLILKLLEVLKESYNL